MERFQKYLVVLVLAFGVVGLIIGLRGFVLGISSVPTLDTWTVFDRITNHGFSPMLGWSPYEDHRPLIPTILSQASLLLSETASWSAIFPQLLTIILIVILFSTIFYLNFDIKSQQRWQIFSFFVLILFAIIHPFNINSLLVQFRTWVGLSLFFSTVSCFLLYMAFDTADRIRRFLVFGLCLLFAVLASATGASGLLSWGVILVGAIAIRANYKYFIVIAVVTTLSVIAFRTRSDIGFIAEGGLKWFLHPIDYLIELSYFFGSVIGRGLFIQPFAHYSNEVSVIIGMLILALALYLVVRWLINVRKLDLSSIGLFAVITFGFGWGAIYILKHGSVPPHPKNWIAAGDFGLIIFPMTICIIF
jgi:hypothetical protein